MNADQKARALARWEGEGGRALKPTEPSLQDPVCGTPVTEHSPHRYEHDGSTYFFCSENCRTKFTADL